MGLSLKITKRERKGIKKKLLARLEETESTLVLQVSINFFFM